MAELEQLQQERDLLREEIAQSNAQLQQSRKELTSVQNRYRVQEASRETDCENDSLFKKIGSRRKFALYAALIAR